MAHFRYSIEEMGFSDYVTFKGWVKSPWESIPDNAIVLIPSFFESFCLVAREAMHYGARMVLSPLSVFFEWIPSELIALDFSAEAFVDKVEEVSSMSRERVLTLYAEALQEFTEEAFVAKFESILRAATNEGYQLPRSARVGRN
jgi:glycosyltransferase involved in cell wall biosynthesis